MEISLEYLDAEIASIQQQKDQASALLMQAEGAIAALNAVKMQLKTEPPAKENGHEAS